MVRLSRPYICVCVPLVISIEATIVATVTPPTFTSICIQQHHMIIGNCPGLLTAKQGVSSRKDEGRQDGQVHRTHRQHVLASHEGGNLGLFHVYADGSLGTVPPPSMPALPRSLPPIKCRPAHRHRSRITAVFQACLTMHDEKGSTQQPQSMPVICIAQGNRSSVPNQRRG